MNQGLTSAVVVAALAAVITLACGDAETRRAPAQTATSAEDSAEGGRLVSVDGRRLYLDCRGSGSPTVVMEAGGEGHSGSWRFVQPGVAGFTRVCVYDRAGAGQSEPAPAGRHAQEVADELGALLEAASVEPPYVLVGHSLGGIIVRYFALAFPDQVAGMVLVDTSHGDQRARTRAVLTDDEWADLEQRLTAMEAPTLSGLDLVGPPLGDIPLVVLSAGRVRGDLAPDVAERLAQVAGEMHRELAALSSQGVRIIAEESGHGIPQEQPDLVIDAVRDVVRAVAGP